MRILRRHLLLAKVLLLFVAACTSPHETTGSVQVAAALRQSLSADDVTLVKVTVSADDMSPLVVDMAMSNGSWGGLIGNIPAGSNRSLLAEGLDSSGTLRFKGQATGVTVLANYTTAVAITLQEVAPPPPYENEVPLIDFVVASTTAIQTGGSLSLYAAAHDPNTGDTLTLAWTASGGTFSSPTAADTSWTAPSSPGIQTLTFTVTDSQGAAVSVTLSINVISVPRTGNAAINISFNLWPVVSKVSATLNRLDAGQSTTVSASAADADGDALTYQWASSCAGSWTNATSSTASFVPSAIPASVCNNCRLTVTVQDGRGGQSLGSLNLCVATSSAEQFPPRFTHFYQSAISASPGQVVTFRVNAMDPQASSLTFGWTANAGSLGTPASGAASSQITWTAPSCVSESNPSAITVTVTNAASLTSTQSFAVTGLPSCTVWAPVKPMASPHYLHSAALLPNGKILVSGGLTPGGPLAAAEVFDPASGNWSDADSMASPRYNHTTILLLNGKLLAMGGENSSGHLSSAEVYDPATGSWSATGSMASPRSNPIATPLPNGKVLVSGGLTPGGLLAAAEVYEPASDTWSVTSSMASPRAEHTATLLSNGKVLVVGGLTPGGASAGVEVYDPASGTWSPTGPMASPRYGHTAALLPNGKVLVSGGYGSGVYLVDAEVYDPASGTWNPTGSMASPRTYHTATLLPSGKVLVAGGYNGSYLATVEVYDPASGAWSHTESMVTPRYVHTASLLPNGKVLVAGGYNGSYLAEVELYTP